MIITVSSTNPLKVESVKMVVTELFDNPEINSVKTSSGVNDMPLNDSETMAGAINRALEAVKQGDYGVGVEGGVQDTEHGMFLFALIAVAHEDELGLVALIDFCCRRESLLNCARAGSLDH
jgi:inosine/xanthosine triphosphatase